VSFAAPSATILIVGDAQSRHSLALGSRYRTAIAEGHEAIDSAREIQADLIVAAFSAPGGAAIEMCAAIRRDSELRHIPVVLIASQGRGSTDVLRAFDAGADDCVDESIDPDVLVARVAVILKRRATDLSLTTRQQELDARVAHLEALCIPAPRWARRAVAAVLRMLSYPLRRHVASDLNGLMHGIADERPSTDAG